jgi:hypothetical protein
MELDARNGDIPSLCERFFVKTNREFSEFVAAEPGTSSRAATERRS